MESWWCTLSALVAFSLILQLDALHVYPVEVKPGECPKNVLEPYLKPCADKCSNDYDCAYNEKCCLQGCGRMCVAINPINPGVKPGDCPKSVLSQYYKPCADQCSNDYDCAFNEKCCSQGCGRTCVAITPNNPINPGVKPGDCPNSVPSQYFKPCADQCSNDYDCAYNEKCCLQGCGRKCVPITPTTPVTPTQYGVKPGDCPKFVLAPYFKPCADKCSNDYDCAFNEKCCLQGCGRTCVAITPNNPINPGVKPGDCPNSVPSQFFKPCADQCSSDFDCAFNEKCCLQGCGRMCVAITPINPTNPGVKPGDCPNSVPSQFFKPCADQCSNDFDCAFNEKCCLQGCGRMCVAITPINPTNPGVKPGDCPNSVPSQFFKPCADQCSNDFDCAFNEKCCLQGCGRTCVAITPNNPINPGVKPGDCPNSVPSQFFKPCADKCSNDFDCAFNEKCCLQGCGRMCVAITPINPTNPGVKPGDCPNSVPSQFFKPCADQCSNDFDCAYNEKCCLQGCGRMCVAITPINPTNPGVKPGHCPKFVLAPYFKPCADKCSNDYDCAYNEKCCYHGCGRLCVAITPINPRVKPGDCPNSVPSQYFKPCADQCSNDYDCAYNEKCCLQGCGRTCVAINRQNPGVKPGDCPKFLLAPYVKPCADQCSNDYNCAFNEKCCLQGCGRKCVPITPTTPVTPTQYGVKPGDCPNSVPSQYFKPCADQCSNDYDCAFNEKCCLQGCGRKCVPITPTTPVTPTQYRVKPGDCPNSVPSQYFKPCADQCSNDYDCAFNEKCCLQGCGRKCVPITPTTPVTPTQYRVKPGDCPKFLLAPYVKPCADQCSNDYNCAFNEKCCLQGCGRKCVPITPTTPVTPTQYRDKPGDCPKFVLAPYFKPCADKCSNDYDCAFNEKCCLQGCGRMCVAINPGVKPGDCPNSVPSQYFKPCADQCSNDYDCAFNKKCCSQGCGRKCVPITPTTPVTPTQYRVKPGDCPKFLLAPYVKPCADQCSNDYNCAFNEKCCLQGCGRKCVPITPTTPVTPTQYRVKPGDCPKFLLAPYVKPCADQCSNDYNCAFNEKCCLEGCGRKCVPITPTTPVTPTQYRVKPGDCPKFLLAPYVKPCADQCSNDYNCAFNEKCCLQGCGRKCVPITPTTPVTPTQYRDKPGDCPKFVLAPYFKPCADKCSNDYDCAFNEKCCLQGCGRMCVAINPGVKPGDCPNSVPSQYFKPCADQCSNDYDCAFNKKCCSQGCGRKCVPITPTTPVTPTQYRVKPGDCPKFLLAPYVKPCADQCSNDYNCAFNEKCCLQGCGRKCVPITPTTPVTPTQYGDKPGDCPKFVLAPYFKPCADKCSNDYDCAYNEKCCYQGCGRMCVAITPMNPINPDKPGECPKYVLSPYFKPCADQCSNDYDCAFNEKCCLQGCGRKCVAIQQEKPGVCPIQHALKSYGKRCVNRCSDDYSCPGNKKCCKFGCGQACLTPTLGAAFPCKPYPLCLYKQR
ncbi:uncharacterized protein LOC114467413 isoform X3 [Gouania willdenowi]|uniref:uncharacterized protein LOC114467413 isoform X3 n=1 Tax=Gouania willdenowi TaxID=441366 RepID=UPI001056BA4C|nr:uncharacterized protein LOC114467413 isoform X3 [Gouania willdenowi]